MRLCALTATLPIILTAANTCAQLRQIDSAKLPQEAQSAFSSAQSVEALARSWSPDWKHDVPKEKVASLLSTSLRDLESSAGADAKNEELLLATGLVAHLAYNLDIEQAYEVAVRLFGDAQKLAPADYRPQWFLGAHRCQSNDLKGGMEQLLEVEDKHPWQQLPIDFWDDYVTCATTNLMPGHTLRAIDHAVHLGSAKSNYTAVLDITQERYKLSDVNSTYSAREAWDATKQKGEVQFTSQLCGMRFTTHSDWRLDIKDVSKGVCAAQIETGPYPAKTGDTRATVLVLTRIANPTQNLEDFVRSFLKDWSSLARLATAPHCPSAQCVAFEIVDKTVYQREGGGHFLAVGLIAPAPEFPGLSFEKPEPPPTGNTGEKITYYRPNARLHRFDGTLYSVILLDSNATIFNQAANDFKYILKSIRLD